METKYGKLNMVESPKNHTTKSKKVLLVPQDKSFTGLYYTEMSY